MFSGAIHHPVLEVAFADLYKAIRCRGEARVTRQSSRPTAAQHLVLEVASGRSASWKRGRLDNHPVRHPLPEIAVIFASLSEAIRHRCASWKRGGLDNHPVHHPVKREVAIIQLGLSNGIRRRSKLWKPG